MPTFNLTGTVTVSAFTSVEAETLEQAIKEAEDRAAYLHFNGSATDPEEVWCVEEVDGEIQNIEQN